MQIYIITNNINKKSYIGKDKNNRKNYFGSGKLIKPAIKKYGKEKFKKEIIQECSSLEELNEREIFWIKELNTIAPNGYNITKGGEGGDTISTNPNKSDIIAKQKNTKKLKGIGKGEKNANFGKHLPDEQKKKMSRSIKLLYEIGKIKRHRMTDEGKRKVSIWMKENNPQKTPEGRIKNRENNIGIKNPNAHIYEFTSPEGKIIEVKGNVKHFCKLNKIPYKHIIKIYNTDNSVNGWKCKKISKIRNH